MSTINAQGSAGATSSSKLAIDNVTRLAEELFEERLHNNYVRTDRMFAVLLLIEWVAGIVVALVVSPLTWSGNESSVHPHVLIAAALGGVIVSVPVLLVMAKPGHTITRHAVACGQILWSALLIHLTGGRIETHFSVFGSLAFLAFYRDWRVLITASAVVVADHCLRGFFYPVSVYGVTAIQPWRWVEHGWWVVFEDVFLVGSCISLVQEMKSHALTQVETQETKGQVQELEGQRDQYKQSYEKQLQAEISRLHLDNVLALNGQPIIGQTSNGTIFSWNQAAREAFGYQNDEVIGKHIKLIVPSRKQAEIDQLMSDAQSGKRFDALDTLRLRKDGQVVKVNITRVPITDDQGKVVGVSELVNDHLQRVAAE